MHRIAGRCIGVFDEHVEPGGIAMMKPGGRHGGNHRGQVGRANENIDISRGPQRSLIHLRHLGSHGVAPDHRIRHL